MLGVEWVWDDNRKFIIYTTDIEFKSRYALETVKILLVLLHYKIYFLERKQGLGSYLEKKKKADNDSSKH